MHAISHQEIKVVVKRFLKMQAEDNATENGVIRNMRIREGYTASELYRLAIDNVSWASVTRQRFYAACRALANQDIDIESHWYYNKLRYRYVSFAERQKRAENKAKKANRRSFAPKVTDYLAKYHDIKVTSDCEGMISIDPDDLMRLINPKLYE